MKVRTFKELLETLRTSEISCSKPSWSTFSEGDYSPFLLALSNTRKRLYVHWGNSDPDVKVYPEKKLRQAVIVVSEPKRRIQESFPHRDYGYDTDVLVKKLRVGSGFPIAFPDNVQVRFNVKSYEEKPDRYGYWNVAVEAVVPETTSVFLVGYDEDHQFVSLLPSNADPGKITTVQKAHAALRPATVSRNALRQGEWFFEPVDKDTKDRLNKHYARRGGYDSWRLGEGDHEVTCQTRYRGKIYVCGYVLNDRHSALELAGWHLATHNLEQQSDGNMWD